MKKNLIIVVTLFSLIILNIYTKKQDNLLEHMSSIETKDYVAVAWKNKMYVPFCAINNSDRGEQIGIVDNDENNQIYKYKGYSEDEWLISFYHSGLMDSSMLMKEIGVSNIPKDLYSEYEWNQ